MSSPAAARIAARRDSLRGRPGRAGVPVPVICRGRPTVLTPSPHDIERYVQYNNTLDVAVVVAPDPNALPTLWAQRSPTNTRLFDAPGDPLITHECPVGIFSAYRRPKNRA
jgi:hypothetical protein